MPPASEACGKQGALINVRNRSSSIHRSKQFRVAFTLGKVNLYLSGKPIRDSRAELVMESFLYMNPLRSVCSIASSISEIVAVPPALLHVVARGGHGGGGLVLVAHGGHCGAVGSRPVRRCCVLKLLWQGGGRVHEMQLLRMLRVLASFVYCPTGLAGLKTLGHKKFVAGPL